MTESREAFHVPRPAASESAACKRIVPDDASRFRRNNFDFLRLMMALMVVYSHAFALYLGSERQETMSLLTNGFYNSGNVGVWVFFIISGFLITHSFERSSSAAHYLAKRIRRIYPAYLMATAICAFVVTPVFAPASFTLTIEDVMRAIAGNLLLGNSFPLPELFRANPHAAINGSLWSIKYEFLCYIGVAVLGAAGLLKRRQAVVALYVLVVIIWCWLDATGRHPGGTPLIREVIGWPYRWFWVLPNFLAGMIAYLYRDLWRRSVLIGVAGVAACLIVFHLPGQPVLATVAAHLLVPPALAYLVFWFAFHPAINLHRTSRFGDFSYGTYLYAFAIQQMLIAELNLNFLTFILLSMGAALLAGVASWFLVERHFVARQSDQAHCFDGR
ncbi:MAG: acyltransferase [Sphingomonas sp.]|nr:acyltransferase [Sphingomonas sp.]